MKIYPPNKSCKDEEKVKFDNMRSDLDSLKQDMNEIKTLLKNIMDK